MSDFSGMRALFSELAESILSLDSGAIGEEAAFAPVPAGSVRSVEALGESVRQTLLGEVSRYRRGALAAAYSNYQHEVSRMRSVNYQLPPSPEGRRALLAYLFETYPQMERTFLTVQHREFAALSDGDVESFLKQLQELGAYEPRELELKGVPWHSHEAVEQQPETD